MNIAEQLANKWIKEETTYRNQVLEAMRAGTPWTSMAAMADGIKQCRIELQKAFNLVGPAAVVQSPDAKQLDPGNGGSAQ